MAEQAPLPHDQSGDIPEDYVGGEIHTTRVAGGTVTEGDLHIVQSSHGDLVGRKVIENGVVVPSKSPIPDTSVVQFEGISHTVKYLPNGTTIDEIDGEGYDYDNPTHRALNKHLRDEQKRAIEGPKPFDFEGTTYTITYLPNGTTIDTINGEEYDFSNPVHRAIRKSHGNK